MTFRSYPGLRKHIKKAHPDSFLNPESAQLLNTDDSELYKFLARIELEYESKDNKSGLYKIMVEATHLTKDQIKPMRKRDIYQRYLERARTKLIIDTPSSDKPPPANDTGPLTRSKKTVTSEPRTTPVEVSKILHESTLSLVVPLPR